MSLMVRSVTVQGDSLSLVLADENEDREIATIYTGKVSTSINTNGKMVSVYFHCAPTSDDGAKHLNKAPVDF